nr:NADH deshydrogenase subunit 4 [Xorides funiuensis]
MVNLLLFFFLFNIIFIMMNKILMQMLYQNFIYLMIFIFILMMSLDLNNYMFNIYYNLGMDFYTLGLILLSFWIISLMLMVSNKIFIMFNYLNYMFMLNLMLLFLIMCFFSLNLIMFYMFFECSLIPVFMMILIWGYQVERIQAGMYMLLYTLFGSMPLFMMIMVLYSENYTLMFDLIKFSKLSFYMYMFLILAFLIKMPMYFMHLWLPKAHVEAPIMGSMILAGVMLKLGSYGLLRFMIIMINLCLKFNKFLLIISLMGGLFSSLICLCQIDMKSLVAYSSVVHMSLLMSGMMTLFDLGYMGAYLMMISHGLCSSGLFCLVNINYEHLNSRSLYINKGLINLFPSLTMIWFLLCSSNISFPPSLNLWSEIMLVNSMIMWSNLLIYIIMFLFFFSTCYTLYLYSYTQHGKLIKMFYLSGIIYISEFLLLLLHWIPLNLLFMIMIIFY